MKKVTFWEKNFSENFQKKCLTKSEGRGIMKLGLRPAIAGRQNYTILSSFCQAFF